MRELTLASLASWPPMNQVEILRRNIDKGLPCGSDRFVEKLENIAGRALRFRRPGRPKKRTG
ncbi:MAG: hypothetical protein DRR42_23730 [Gammaproteobacteria bacterium]|nr:MAG: hypothetical protein DRR42_23730 [Gammaproteobacteria bacterium]